MKKLFFFAFVLMIPTSPTHAHKHISRKFIFALASGALVYCIFKAADGSKPAQSALKLVGIGTCAHLATEAALSLDDPNESEPLISALLASASGFTACLLAESLMKDLESVTNPVYNLTYK